ASPLVLRFGIESLFQPREGETPAEPDWEGETPAEPDWEGETPAEPDWEGETPAEPDWEGEAPAEPPSAQKAARQKPRPPAHRPSGTDSESEIGHSVELLV